MVGGQSGSAPGGGVMYPGLVDRRCVLRPGDRLLEPAVVYGLSRRRRGGPFAGRLRTDSGTVSAATADDREFHLLCHDDPGGGRGPGYRRRRYRPHWFGRRLVAESTVVS